jgi:hypothetical protein
VLYDKHAKPLLTHQQSFNNIQRHHQAKHGAKDKSEGTEENEADWVSDYE